MQLFLNQFPNEGALVEREPQGNASTPIHLPDEQAELLSRLIVTPELSAALAKLFLAGVRVGERSVRGNGAGLQVAIEDHLEWMETGKVDGVGFDEASAVAALRAALVKAKVRGR